MSTNEAFPSGGPEQWVALAALVVLCLAAGWLGSIATTRNIPTWYAGLNKPSFNPPNGIFPVVWTVLYVLMAVAAWLIWREDTSDRGSALAPFLVQLALNVGWSFAFFGARNPLLGLVVIGLLLVAIVWTILAFWPISSLAALLLVPYLAWVAFASVLNAAIYKLN